MTTRRPSLGNLPIDLSNFIGRGREIAEVKRLLWTTRLLTLTGPGGCGKTRLALRVAGELLPEFEDDVWLTELGPLADASLVPQAVASALGAREQPGLPLIETLAGQLAGRKVLLVLDNCEHLVNACAQLAGALLRACADLRILATSRETLNLTGERVWVVPPLSLPEPQPWRSPATGQAPFSAFEQSEAVRLFVDRAKAASPVFTLTSENAPWVAAICRRLDGMPLAIELAAARVRALSVQQIAGRLEDRFHLLTTGSRTAPPRHQSLEAALDWSYSLLSDSERNVLRRLAVFAGGWTLEAAETVCQGGGVEAGDILDILSHLVDKSLVQADKAEGGRRYRLLETIRQHAQRRLVESGEEAGRRDLHLDYFVQWIERAEANLGGQDQLDWLGRFEAEHDNLRAALGWSLTSEAKAEPGLRLASFAGNFWRRRGYHSEGRMRLRAALPQPGAVRPENAAARVRALNWAGSLAFAQSDYAAARAVAQASLALCRGLGPAGKAGVANALEMLGEVATEEGDYRAALPFFEEALAIYRERRDMPNIGSTLSMFGWLAMRQGDFERAAVAFEEGLAVCRAHGDPTLIAQALAGLGELAVRRKD